MSQVQTEDHKRYGHSKDGEQKLADRADELKKDSSRTAQDAASNANAGAQAVAKHVQQTVDEGRRSAAQTVERLTACISGNPLTTLGLALGVGVVIGFLARGPRA